MPGKIYDLSDLDNFELPPLPSAAKKPAAGDIPASGNVPASSDAPAPGNAPAGDAAPAADFELPPLPAKKTETPGTAAPVSAPAAPAADDFELPPLPVRKPAAAQSADSTAADTFSIDTQPSAAQTSAAQPSPRTEAAQSVSPTVNGADDFELPPLPVRKPAENAVSPEAAAETPVSDAAENVSPAVSAADDFDLPPLPVRKSETNEAAAVTDEHIAPPEQDIAEETSDVETSDDDFDLPPLPEKKPEETEQSYPEPEQETYEEPAGEEAEPEYIPEEEKPRPRVSLEDDLDIDLETVTPADIGIDDPSKALAPMHTAREAQARNVREKMKMEDLAMDLDGAPVLDDLSDEYAAPEKRADDLLERDHLESDEKQVLKQRLQEDLSRRPENFNARASRNMYNKLMEEKKLKIARKGMLISFIPIVMELIAAGICFFTMNWGTYQWLSYVAAFGAFGSLLLLIKSKHTKMFSIIISAITVLAYAVPGLVLYALDEGMREQSDYIVHITMAAVAALLNVGAILILTKNEAVNTYYTTKFKRK